MNETMVNMGWAVVVGVFKFLPLLIAIIGHEIMHGRVAYYYGDTTAKDAGRLSINPLVHIDWVGSIILPAFLFFVNAPFLFGWAKPVPVRMDIVIRNGGYFGALGVSLAGILYNLALVLIGAVLLYLLNGVGFSSEIVAKSIWVFIYGLILYNLVLAFFNLLPIPPLDGSQALSYLGLMFKNDFFARIFSKIHPAYGMIILIIFLSTPLSNYFFMLVSLPLDWILRGLE
ncbi:site-2 protease family protein [Helicobacter valdiviensis]|nr:site-2 protease family protein [Helicobacter valdiviensis]